MKMIRVDVSFELEDDGTMEDVSIEESVWDLIAETYDAKNLSVEVAS